MSFKQPVIITLVIVGATAALMLLRTTQQPLKQDSARASVVHASRSSADTTAAASPNLSASRGQVAPPIGDFVYLFDVSGSTKSSSAQNAFDQGVALLQPMFEALRQLDELMPQRHRVATIGAMSLRGSPGCDIHVTSRTLFTATDSMAPVRAMRACADSLKAARSEPYTDISGALSFAALSLKGDWRAVRGIVLVTDLDEDRAPGTLPARADLRGLCVAVYTLITPDVQRDPPLLDRRQQEWQSKLTGWGAYHVHMQSSLGFDAGDLQSFFRGCERH